MDRLRVPPLGAAAALLLGIGALALGLRFSSPDMGALMSAAWLALIYFAATLPLGIAWPRASWVWGLLVVLPMAGILLLSVGFAGQIGAFLRNDIILLTGATGGATSGGAAGKLLRQSGLRRRRANRP